MTDTTPLFPEQPPTTSLNVESRPPRRKVRATAIVWGAILLVIAATAFLLNTVGVENLGPNFVLWSIVGIGSLFVLIGIVGAIVRAATRN